MSESIERDPRDSCVGGTSAPGAQGRTGLGTVLGTGRQASAPSSDGAGGGESIVSQRTVEQVIGRLVTDEGFRRRFAEDPRAAIEEVVRWRCELNSCEWQALLRIDAHRVEQLAESIDPGLLKADLSGGVS